MPFPTPDVLSDPGIKPPSPLGKLKLNNEFHKVARYEHTYKSLAIQNTNNESSEREIKETTPFTITTKRIKYLGINLPKETKDLYAENYKTLMKEIKDGTNRWRDIIFLD